MANKTKTKKQVARKRTTTKKVKESDSTFFLKLVLYLILSSLWLRVELRSGWTLPFPLGALIALFYAMHDHFQIDRKIELALILVGMFISFWLPIGIFIAM